MLSMTESVVVAIRMMKWLVATEIWMHENRVHPESDLGPEDHDAIRGVAAEMDVSRIDVLKTRSSGRNTLERQITIKLAFGRNTTAPPTEEQHVAVGNLVVEKWESWEPISGKVKVMFPSGYTRSGIITDYTEDSTSLPLL